MATGKDYISFILDQLSGLEDITCRMMGEYLKGLFEAIYDELPMPKKKAKKKNHQGAS